VLTTPNEWKAAIESYRQALEIQEKMAQADARDAETNSRLTYMLTDMGEALAKTDQLEKSLECHRRAIEILRKLSAAHSENKIFLSYLTRSFRKNGDALLEAANMSGAIEFYNKALDGDEEMASADLNNMDVRLALAEDYVRIGQISFMQATSSASPSKKAQFLQEARKRFEQSRNVNLDMQSHNLKTNPINQSLNNLTKEISRCDEALAKL
jgi:tetratricopeptide (TPR) repeat protein